MQTCAVQTRTVLLLEHHKLDFGSMQHVLCKLNSLVAFAAVNLQVEMNSGLVLKWRWPLIFCYFAVMFLQKKLYGGCGSKRHHFEQLIYILVHWFCFHVFGFALHKNCWSGYHGGTSAVGFSILLKNLALAGWVHHWLMIFRSFTNYMVLQHGS